MFITFLVVALVLGTGIAVRDQVVAGVAQALNDWPAGWPKAAVESSVPLGTPAPVVGTSTDFAFLTVAPDGSPVGFDPCRPIHYVVNTAQQPPGAEVYLPRALAAVGAATGLTFVDDGPTTEQFTPRRAPVQRARYGDRWAPVLITWTSPQNEPHLAGDVLGFGGGRRMDRGGHAAFVTGEVVLDAPQFAGLFASFAGWRVAQGAMQHELGHLVGLGHVDAADQLMHPSARLGVNEFGVGDLTGLSRLGQRACTPGI